MEPAHIKRRDALIARADAALGRWPERSGAAFTAEMSAVANALEALAEDLCQHGDDALECSRSWRFAGSTYVDLGADGDTSQNERAVRAFRRADALLATVTDPVEVMKVNYCLGNALLQLCEAKDLGLASDGCERLIRALPLARAHMPGAVAQLEQQIADAERIVSLLSHVEGLDARIGALKSDLKLADRQQERAAEADGIKSLFGTLQQQFELAKSSLDPTRGAGLRDLMQRLQGVVERGTAEGLTLQDIQANRGKLESLARELSAPAKKSSLPGTGAPPGTRHAKLLAALQELKMFVGAVGMDSATPMGMREASLDLFARIARLTTAISEAGTDTERVSRLEYDQTRGLAHEVRRFSRRAHAMLAHPVWPGGSSTVDVNRVFFSGSDGVRSSLVRVCERLGIELGDETAAGADFAVDRWQALRTSAIAVFDLAERAPQVYYELGIALTLGTPLLLLAPADTEIPFDVAQPVNRYPPECDLDGLLAEQLDVAFYGSQSRGSRASGLAATLAYAERLAADQDKALLGVALQSLRRAGNDPVRFGDALDSFYSFLGHDKLEIVLPRWPGAYPDPAAPSWFAVMPFRAEREAVYEAMRDAAIVAGITPVRGDTAGGQEIIESIWQELCRATHVTVDLSGFNLNVCLELGIAHTLGRPVLLVGEKGTSQRLAEALPTVAKWRCHTYDAAPGSQAPFRSVVQAFFESSVPRR